MKNLGLSGAFDAVKKDWESPDSIYSMTFQPVEEWEAQNIRGKEIEKGIPETAAVSMSKAMTMSRGVIPKEAWNSSVLGELVAPPAPVEPAKVVHNGVKMPLPQNAGVSRTAKADVPRPKRNVKKRTYGDSSFEGYGEGYVDDDLQEAGYSTGDGDDRAGARKRPKKVGSFLFVQYFIADKHETAPSHSFQGPIRQNSYGPGMVGA